MHERRPSGEKIYPTYEPYPVSRDVQRKEYSREDEAPSERLTGERLHDTLEFPFFEGETVLDDLTSSEPAASNADRAFRPLRLLESLFADRVGLLRRALQDLESSSEERAKLTQDALADLDNDILECERDLAPLHGLLNDPERRRPLERRLSDLKRERRREALLSWRDFVWLRAEIRKLQREIDALNGTATRAEDHPPQR